MDNFSNYLHQLMIDPIFTLFLIVGIGLMVGAINIKGFSLGIAGVFIVGVVFGLLGLITPKHITTFGLFLFMYVLGIQGGPMFFNSFSKKGIPYILVAICMIVVSIIVTIATGKILNLANVDILGVYTGSFNNSSGLAILMEGEWGEALLPSYGIVYPLGAVGAVFFIQLLPIIFKKNIAAEFLRHNKQSEPELFITRKFVVENKELDGKTLAELQFRTATGATISRIRRNKKLLVPNYDTKLELDDVIMVVGSIESMEQVKNMVGCETHENIDIDPEIMASQFIINNRLFHNTDLSTLALSKNYGVVITRILRSGIEIPPSHKINIATGDILTVVGKKRNIRHLEKILGKSIGGSAELDLISLAIGSALGIMLGKITVTIPCLGSFTLGMTGGVLLMGLFMGYARRFGILTSQISEGAKNVIKDIGLASFSAGVGASAGITLLGSDFSKFIPMLVLSILIIFSTLISVYLLCKYLLKMDIVTSLACVCGSMANSSSMNILVRMTGSEAPTAYFATCYPLATFGSIIATQILSRILVYLNQAG